MYRSQIVSLHHSWSTRYRNILKILIILRAERYDYFPSYMVLPPYNNIGHIIQSLVLRKLVFIFYQNTHNEYINIASALRIYNLLKVRVLRVNNP